MLIPCSICKQLNEVSSRQCEKCGIFFYEQNKSNLPAPINAEPKKSSSPLTILPKKINEESKESNPPQIISEPPAQLTSENSGQLTSEPPVKYKSRSTLFAGLFIFAGVCLILVIHFVSDSQEKVTSASLSSSVQSTPINQSVDDTIEGKVVDISDGDSITVLDKNNLELKIKLVGITIPETKSNFGEEAKKNLITLVFGKNVFVSLGKIDNDSRKVGKILYEGKDINLEQVKAGMAQYDEAAALSEEDHRLYSEAEIAAKTTKSGLWSILKPKSVTEQLQQTKTKDSDVGIKTPRSKTLNTLNQNDSHSKSSKAVASTPIPNTSISTPPENKVAPSIQPERNTSKSSTRTYVLGPRGGCFYINSNGNKTYVDRSLCN